MPRPTQLPPNFYRVVSCGSRLNQIYGLQLNHHNINFMYSLCSNIKSDHYLKVRDVWIRLISCLLDSKKNLAGEFVQVSGNWLIDELPCPLSLHDVGRYRVPFSILNLILSLILLTYVLTNPHFDLLQKGKDSNRTLRSCT